MQNNLLVAVFSFGLKKRPLYTICSIQFTQNGKIYTTCSIQSDPKRGIRLTDAQNPMTEPSTDPK